MTDLLIGPDLLTHVSAGAREYGRAHDWDEIVADLESVYLQTRAG